jgi:glycosyltransferase involved in cell wall biosynthesis
MPLSTRKKRVAISVTNSICYDQRILKMAGTINALGCDVFIIGRESGACTRSDTIPYNNRRFRMIFRKGFLFYMFFNIRLFIFFLFHKYDILVANDLDTLFPNFLISKLRNTPLVYDSHEYFTGVPEIQNRPFVKWVWKSIEKAVFPGLHYVITVSDSMAIQYEKEYGFRPVTVRNCSMNADQLIPISREDLQVHSDHLLVILQGTGININRGGEELIDALNITENVSLLVIGSGDRLELMIEKAAQLKLEERIRFIPRCPRELLMRYTKSADAGLSLDKDSNLNYNFSLPNKLFDYICAGIPVIASDLPEISKILTEYKCGVVISEVTPEKISKALIKLRDKRSLLAELKSNADRASETLNWGKESVIVENLYKSIIKIL